MHTWFWVAAAGLGSLCLQGQAIDFQLAAGQVFHDADVARMAFADVDGDGDQDLLLTGNGGTGGGGVQTSLFLNDGSGQFAAVANDPFTNVFGGDVLFLDADGDGDPDVLISGSTHGGSKHTALYLNDGNGGFAPAAGSQLVQANGGRNDAGDVDGDGDPDLLLTGINPAGQAFTTLYLNQGGGLFSEQAASPFAGVKSGAAKLADIDGDGDLDVVLCGENNSGQAITAVYANDGTGSFAERPNAGLQGFMQGSDLAVGDVDGDGDADLLLCGLTSTGPTTRLYLNDGSGLFAELGGTAFTGVMAGTVDLADFDGDGDLDLLVVGAGNPISSVIYANQGGQVFTVASSLIGYYLADAALADVNGDDKIDLVLGGTSTGQPIRAPRLYLNSSITVGLPPSPALQGLSVSPNPCGGRLQIAAQQPIEGQLSLYDALGRVVHAGRISGRQHTLDLPGLPAGIYYLDLQAGGARETRKIVVK